ncbi:MAG: tetratricopeptide repeat protein [Blastocatellia bacterium]|nr:tetratricopeptide repeat protein [Blastocatellia bacterium]
MTTGKLDKSKYNIGELAYNREGEVFLRAWPLFYSSQNGDFRPDIESVSGDQYFFEVPLNKQIRLPKIEERINNTIPNANNLAEASSLSLEGDSYKEKGKYKEAEECYKKALELREKIDHPDAALSLNSLGEIYYSQNNLTDAKAFLERALQICRGKLDLLFTATVLNNLANVRISQAEARVSKNGPFMKLALQQIEPLYIEALKIREQKLGKEHLDTALSLNNLALLYSKQGYLEKAEPLFKKALEIFEKSLGSEDVTTKLVKANYRDMLVKKSKP